MKFLADFAVVVVLVALVMMPGMLELYLGNKHHNAHEA